MTSLTKALIGISGVMTLAALDRLEAQGNQLRYPHPDIVQEGLFELRAGKKDITRTFFAFAKGKKIYILRTFIKNDKKDTLCRNSTGIKKT